MLIGAEVPYAGVMGPRRTEFILAVVVALSLAAVIALAQTDPETPLRPLSFIFALGFGSVLLLRRGLPRIVVVLSVLGTFAYYSLDLTPIGVALPVVAALFSVAEVGRTRFAIGAGAVVFLVSTAFRVRDDSLPPGRLLGSESISTLALIAAAITLGYAVATHRRFLTQQTQLLALQDERAREEADQRIANERLELSRDLHDTLGHRLSVISLHADVGIESLERSQGPAVSESLTRVRTEATESLSELRSIVRVLRTGDEHTRTSLGLDGVETLLDQAREAGVVVESRIGVLAGELPSSVETVIFRVVQEGITNVLRHSSATEVSVEISAENDVVVVTVADNGLGEEHQASSEVDRVEGREHRSAGSHGLQGMSERVHLLGGDLRTHTETGGGFVLRASIPRSLPR